jgi:hypothetical protein
VLPPYSRLPSTPKTYTTQFGFCNDLGSGNFLKYSNRESLSFCEVIGGVSIYLSVRSSSTFCGPERPVSQRSHRSWRDLKTVAARNSPIARMNSRSIVVIEHDPIELIRIWTCAAAPQQYKDLFPYASDLYWIALVPSTLVWEFTQQLWFRQCSGTDSIQSCRLAGGATVFCGPLET